MAPLDDMDHNPACAYWDIGSYCNCGAIDRAKGLSHSDILEARKRKIIKDTSREIYESLRTNLINATGRNPLNLYDIGIIEEVLREFLLPYQIV